MRKTIIIILLILIFKNNLYAQNILISNQFKPNEPTIVMDPNNPNVLVAGANLNNYYFSSDTGYTWTAKTLSSSHGVWGDPVIAVDTASNFYFFHLSNPPSGNWVDRIVCQKSLNNGESWSDGTFTGLNGKKVQDKQWSAIDRKNNNIYLTWTQFDKYNSSNPLDSSFILFSKSVDGGITWSNPLRINEIAGDCIDDDNTVEGAVPAVGPNGEIYVAWAGPNGIVFNKSKDQGDTWLKNEIKVDSIHGGWAYSIPGINRCNGLPVTACDTSTGPNRGTIYINWSDQQNGVLNTDIWLVKSKDGGQTWSSRIKVNNDNTNRQQFFTWMTIDQTNGYLYFVFYDRRNYTDNSTDVYVALSMDGGSTFINHRISQSSFVPNKDIFFGDYTNITAHKGIIRPIWTRLNNGQLSIMTDITKLNDILLTNNEIKRTEDIFDFENYPNPAKNCAFVSFKLHTKSKVNLSVVDTQGNIISKIISNQNREYGKYIERVEIDELKIAPGIYFIRLEVDNQVKTIKQIIVK